MLGKFLKNNVYFAMQPYFQRLEMIIGSPGMEILGKSHAIVVGLGGVGSWAAEALVRSGIGSISLVDSDQVNESNINRQVQATIANLGRAKTKALEERLLGINPLCKIKSFPVVFSAENSNIFEINKADYILDAIDVLKHKLDLIEISCNKNIKGKFYSSMGMAQKLDPTKIRTVDIWETKGCPLARLVRQGLKKRNFTGNFTAVYSTEKLPRINAAYEEDNKKGWDSGKKVINGSSVTVTAAAGMALASLVLNDIYRSNV